MNTITRIASLALLMLVLAGISSSAQTDFWQHLEKPYGGGVFVFAMAPNGDIIVGSEFDGAFRSTDNGMTWNRYGVDGGVYVLAVNAAGDAYVITDGRGGIGRSTDDGMTWEQKAQGIERRRVRYLALAPNDHIFAVTDSGVYRSTNGMDSWSESGLMGTNLDAVFADPAGTVYAISDTALYRSSDDGATWTRSGEGVWDIPISGLAFGATGDLFVVSGNRIIRSANHGVDFTVAATLPQGMRLSRLAVNGSGQYFTVDGTLGAIRVSAAGDTIVQLNLPVEPTNLALAANGNVLAGSERQGIWASTENGDTWSQRGLVYGGDISALAEIDGMLYAGVRHDGLYRSTNGGNDWTHLTVPGTPDILAIAATTAGTIFAGADQGSAFRSTDNGASWTKLSAEFSTDVNDVLVTGPGTAFIASNDGLLRSVDNGDTWFTMIANQNVYSLAQAPSGDLWATGFDKAYRSTDGGLTWSESSVTSDNISFSSLGILPDGSVVVGGSGRMLRSTDGGASWSPYTIGCTEPGPFYMLTGGDGATYAGDGCGIYRLTGGSAWTKVADWPDDESRQALLVTSAKTLYAGGRSGLFRSQSPLGVRETRAPGAAGFHLSATPNPARSHVAIAFALPKPGHVSLAVHSARGDAAATLVDGVLGAGEHTVEWDAAGMPSGIYIYQLRSGDGVETGRIEIVK